MAENLGGITSKELILSAINPCVLVKWKVFAHHKVSKGSILAVYKKIRPDLTSESGVVVLPKLKSDVGGLVKKLLVAEGEKVQPGQAVILIDVCEHKTVMKDMCAECGADLRREPGIPGSLKEPVSASVALVHNIPELRVSQQEAEVLAKKDKETLLKSGKLVLLVDLDQTLIHTTTENVPPDMKDVYHFQLYGQNCWYHTKFRPGWKTFLEDMSKYYELHIFTMGSRMYAHTIARMLDPTRELFGDRIRSRDESFDMFSKYRDLSALFPCDDSMVCIIDDREDIWDCAPNLVTVKPYRFFTGTGDINAPPGSNQAFTHPSAIPLHEDGANTKVKNASDEVAGFETEEPVHEATVDDGNQVGGNRSVPKGSASDAVSVKLTCEEMAQTNRNSTDKRQITKHNNQGSECGSVNKEIVEKRDEVKPFSSEAFVGNIHGVCDVHDTISNVNDTDKLVKEDENRNDSSSRGDSPTAKTVEEKQSVSIEKEKLTVEAEAEKDVGIARTTEEKPEWRNEAEKSDVRCDLEDGVGLDSRGRESGLERGGLGGGASDSLGKGKNPGQEYHAEDNDDYLLYLEEILRRIHRRFYEILASYEKNKISENKTGRLDGKQPDLRCIVPELRCNVLKGTNVVFTGVIPTNASHEESQAWKIASRFGANVTRDLMTRKNTADRSKRTSHVIAARPGTEKACQALRLPSVKLVNPNWLWTCVERWEWVDERLFPVEESEEYKTRKNWTPSSSRRATPKRQLDNDAGADVDTKRSFGEGKSGIQEWKSTNVSDQFKEVVNPFLSFSSGEMEEMDKEVEDLMRCSEDENDDNEDGEILGSVSSSSGSVENERDSVGSGKDSRIERDGGFVDPEGNLGDINTEAPKGKTVDFLTIKQTLERRVADRTVAKRRRLEFWRDDEPAVKKERNEDSRDDDHYDAGTDAEFSSDESSSSAEEGEDEDSNGNDMAAMLEAAIYHF